MRKAIAILLLLIPAQLFACSGAKAHSTRKSSQISEIERLSRAKRVLKTALKSLEAEEEGLWQVLSDKVKRHLSCCVSDGKVYVTTGMSSFCPPTEEWYKVRAVSLTSGVSLDFIRQVLSISRICKIGQTDPPITNPTIRSMLEQIEKLRKMQDQIRSYLVEISIVENQLRIATALKSSQLASIREKAAELINKVNSELYR